ncbi:ATP-dependent Lhr-like helicase [Friedmanniella endophytica]|uniref:ATP-dependent Lhr-like helicase n=1 Tax=Microlunatus kandeliicorticis TaxID=1759536 RepID=A0A7W3IUC6_9ACTN|nr:ATP-dependent helicase [Microlunatus kandeliicorticis]MBA8795431.1 ATP-dependent Lhr-like helicase [Microlunatus kandeliicorticis]
MTSTASLAAPRASADAADDPLAAFAPATRSWFTEVFAAPTAAQAGAWRSISRGDNALVIAPTGSGKTLAAFLWALDQLTRRPPPPPKQRCRVLYVSPLKALAVDVERNLRAPLAGIRQTAGRLGLPAPEVSVGVRSGDTQAADRRRLVSRPPDILITTPESLFLMLTSQARDVLRWVDTVIVDEVHALAGSKRGAHLALSLERLDRLRAQTAAADGEPEPGPAQRIGLSATVRPAERVAGFLGGRLPVEIVAPPAEKVWDLEVVVPVEDMSALGAAGIPDAGPATGSRSSGDGFDDPLAPPTQRPSIWPHVESQILDLISAHRSSIVFANSRRLAERLTAHLNELHAERIGADRDASEAPDHQRDGQDDEPDEHDGLDGALRVPGPPAQIMAQSGASAGHDGSGRHGTAAEVIARAHHGSVSKEQRAQIEDDLKSGRLPCVVATSSLELGIDMGAVDIVIQVESPPSVASGLQRVGRAGHQVGAVSRGVFFPNHRGDLVESAVVVERMRAGAIEEVAELRNPLDVLAQQIVAIVSEATEPRAGTAADEQAEISADEVYALVRRASNFATLPRSAYDAVLDMLSGRYPSEDFAELRPRLVWHRETGTLTGRRGAQRLAVTSGGTIPDRGLFGVFLVDGLGDTPGGRSGGGRRVGELDEEMVYESRVGDVFTLGTTSWRIEQITHDQVRVSPAPGVPGRLPFWKGDAPPRPAELGLAFGGFVRELAALPEPQARERLAASGLDDWAQGNLIGYLSEQQQATRMLPTDQVVVFERFRDELGDWRVCVHSPLGQGVLAPWALVIEHAARERYGTEVQATATNDGIVLRIPDTESEPPGADLITGDVEQLEQIVTDEVGGSALFASRFRECAARALLLPRRDPRSRSPLWQQRMRSAQLLSAAARFPEFPIVLETMRECLTDVFDLQALIGLQQAIAAKTVRVVEVETSEPSPFAKSLLFGYVGAFVYEGDVPLAEKKAAALSLDAGLLAELLGKDGLKQLLDPEVIASTKADLQGLSAERQAGTVEQLFDLIRTTGPFDAAEISARCAPDLDAGRALRELVDARRVVPVRIAGDDRFAVIEDVPKLRDGLGIPVPPGVAAAFTETAEHPIADLVLRWARTHGPFELRTVARRYGLGQAVVDDALELLVRQGAVVTGSFTDDLSGEGDRTRTDGELRQYCHQKVLALIKRRTLARLRKSVEPVEQTAFARFLPEWQGVGSNARGTDAVLGALELLAGYPLPASAVESVVLPARVSNYQPAMLDELTTSGEVTWVGDGPIGENDGWVRFYLTGMDLPPPPVDPTGALASELLGSFEPGGGFFFETLVPAGVGLSRREDYVAALWDLVWSGHLTGDTFGPVRARTASGTIRRPRQNAARARGGAGAGLRRAHLQRPGAGRRPGGLRMSSPETAGRWSRVITGERGEAADKERFAGELFGQLDRYGVLTRGSVLAERGEGGFGAAYRALSTLEESGQCRRGYFVEGLGAAQFAVTGAIDRLREHSRDREPDQRSAQLLAACDPANAYGAALPWPEREGHRPGRKAGAVVVLVDGELVLYVERGGKTLLCFRGDSPEDREVVGLATRTLAEAVSAGRLGRITVEKADGDHVFHSGVLKDALLEAGFTMTPQGLRLRPAR